MTTIKVNKKSREELAVLAPPASSDFPEVSFKNFRLSKALVHMNDYCKSVVARMAHYIQQPTKFQYVDVKVHDLKPGQQTANGLWHLDSSLNPGPYYENYLFVTGEHNLTEFATGEMEIPYQETAKGFNIAISSLNPTIERINSCTLTRFWGDTVHRGPECEIPENRLLIRLVATDQHLPSYRI